MLEKVLSFSTSKEKKKRKPNLKLELAIVLLEIRRDRMLVETKQKGEKGRLCFDSTHFSLKLSA